MSLVERIIGSELFLKTTFCQIISCALLEHFLLTYALSVCKIKCEGRQSQLFDNCNARHVLSQVQQVTKGQNHGTKQKSSCKPRLFTVCFSIRSSDFNFTTD